MWEIIEAKGRTEAHIIYGLTSYQIKVPGELEDGVLVEGENTITFVFANAYEGTTGFSIVDVRILLRE